MSRLAQHYRVFWTEEPHIEIGDPSEEFAVTEEYPNLHVGRLIYRSNPAIFWARLNETLDRSGGHAFKVSDQITEASLLFDSPAQPMLEWQVQEWVRQWRRGPLVLWLYTPAAMPFIELLQPDLVVYDVMDELTTFKFAPQRLQQQAQELLARADLVFAGGPSLHEARLMQRPDIQLFPSGVDQGHFARALDADLELPAELAGLSRPIVGFFGVIDERIDLPLLAQAAAVRPDWSWVLVGPVLKIEERDLPRLPNIHYMGKQDYARLPAFLKAFDVAMMPFARNEATRFISPTKTLEYMAGHKPIVSTSIRDVIGLYGSVVQIADEPAAFVAAVQTALNEQPQVREQRIGREQALLERYAWDNIAAEMRAQIQARLLVPRHAG